MSDHLLEDDGVQAAMTSEFNWSPGIGDPSFGGWLTVVLYVAAALLSFRAANVASQSDATRVEISLWQLLAVGLVVLGINKQLDLQSALTELGRYLAQTQGWYDMRRTVQFAFILTMAISAVGVGVYVLIATMRMPASTRLAVFGAFLVVTFVVIRT